MSFDNISSSIKLNNIKTYDTSKTNTNNVFKKQIYSDIEEIDYNSVETEETVEIEEVQKDNELVIAYTGDGFLQQMIRIITGTLIEVGTGRKEPEDIIKILESKDRSQAGYTVPAEGLALYEVIYAEMDGNK